MSAVLQLARPRAAAAGTVVEVRDPRRLSVAERDAILGRLRRARFAIYASPVRVDDAALVLALASQLGLGAPASSPEGCGATSPPAWSGPSAERSGRAAAPPDRAHPASHERGARGPAVFLAHPE